MVRAVSGPKEKRKGGELINKDLKHLSERKFVSPTKGGKKRWELRDKKHVRLAREGQLGKRGGVKKYCRTRPGLLS